MKTIVLGGGCFWCTEAVYRRIEGVETVVSGYAGGDSKSPNYENHGSHAEVVKIRYDETIIKLSKLLEVFFYVHDPTTVNRQGNDIGESYRSIILCNDSEQEIAEKAKQDAQKIWDDPIVTEIKTLKKFYPAEDYHQDYYSKNHGDTYCQVIINPKITKFEKKFINLLK